MLRSRPHPKTPNPRTMSEPAIEQKSPWRLWFLAAIGAVALHLGCAALAIARIPSDDNDDSLGTNAIEVGLDVTSPHVDPSDLPPGPDVDAAVASPLLNEQKAEVKPTDLPKETPTETEDPDRAVSQNATKKPTDDDPKVETVQTAASPESTAQEATARQTIADARETETMTAPNIGIGLDRGKLTANWGRQISAYFELHKRYPKVEKGKTAKVKVTLVLNRQGHVVSVDVLESSGDPLFDEAALSMIHRSDPVPRPPAKLTDEEFKYNLDVNFKSKE
jgi:periplasmic protein TonB